MNDKPPGWMRGWQPERPTLYTNKSIAIVGSGPAGLSCAQQLTRAGHDVVVFEKRGKLGGLMRYGVPDYKLDKVHIDERLYQMNAEGTISFCSVHVGVNKPIQELIETYDAVVLACGAEKPRDLQVPGRWLHGVHFAMEFLAQQNKRVSGEQLLGELPIFAKGKRVLIVGAGYTAADCMGTAKRQRARSIKNFAITPELPETLTEEQKSLTWPHVPKILHVTPSHEEVGIRPVFSTAVTGFTGTRGHVKRVHCVRVDSNWRPVAETEFSVKADLVLIAIGFAGPVYDGILATLGVEMNERGNVKADDQSYRTNVPNVFVAGDMRRGASLIVWAIREGRQCAHAVDKFLMGETTLPR